MGVTLGEIIYEIGGGIPDGRKFKAVQTGGPWAAACPRPISTRPVDFDSLRAAGAVMGSGGMIVADETTCMVEFSKYFMKFVVRRELRQVPALPHRQHPHAGNPGAHHRRQGRARRHRSRCKYWPTGCRRARCARWASWPRRPVLSALRHFEDEFLTHIKEARCPAAGCQMLVRARCVSACPAGVDVPAYLSLIAQGRYAEALAVHRDSNPFPLDLRPRLPGVLREALPPRRHRRADRHPPGQALHGRPRVRRALDAAEDGARARTSRWPWSAPARAA